MKKNIFILAFILIVIGFFAPSRTFAWSQNYHETDFVSRPEACGGLQVYVEDYFAGGIDDDRIQTLQIDVFRRNWNNTTNRELTYITTVGKWGGWQANNYDINNWRNADGSCVINPNDVFLRIYIEPKAPNAPGVPSRYAISSFDAPLIKPPGRANNDKIRVLIKLFANQNWPGNVTLDSPPNGSSHTSNVFPDRGFWATGPRNPADLGEIPSIGSFFDYGLRLVTGPGPEDFQWASPEVFYPGFHSGGETDCPAPRHISDNAPGIAPPPNIAFRPCDYPDANSRGTQMYKPGTNFTDPYPYDGNYRWNVTYGIGPWNSGSPGSPGIMSPQQSYYSGHAISEADKSGRTFRLLTDIRPTSITKNGPLNPDGTHVTGQPITFTATTQNFSSGIAANTNTPITYSVDNITTGTTVWTNSAIISSFINPGTTVPIISGSWTATAGDYRVTACVNNPYTRLAVQGAPVCINSTFSVGTPPVIPVVKTITGRVYSDKSKDGIFQTGEEWTGTALQVSIDPATQTGTTTVMTTTNGIYTIPQVVEGTTYIVSFTQPSGYKMTQPVPPNPPQYSVTVGTGCSPAVNCSGGNIVNLNFGFTNNLAWALYTGLDVRQDGGFENPVPQTIDTSCTDPNDATPEATGYSTIGETSSGILKQTAGVIFFGSGTSPIYGPSNSKGFLSQFNWRVGNGVYSGNSNLGLSYDSLNSAAVSAGQVVEAFPATTSLSSLGGGTGREVYKATGDITITDGIVSGGKQIFLLVDGNVTIEGNITTDTSSVLVVAAKGNITVDAPVGTSSFSCANTPANSGQIQGIFTTHNEFVVKGIGAGPTGCVVGTPDKMLIIEGTVITNATGNNNNKTLSYSERDLCGENANFPSVTIRQRPDFIINFPDFAKNQNLRFKELKP